MSELTFDDPCLVFALRRESAPFLRLFPPQQRFPGAPCWARFCGPAWLTVLVLETGVGPERTRRAADWLLNKPLLENVPYRPKLVLSVGFCGALHEGRRVGDIILATEIRDAEGQLYPVTWPGELPAGQWKPPLHRERLLSVSHLVATVEEKQALGARHEAAVVDMESAWLARACAAKDVPFGCVRAVSDDCQTPLSPRLISCLSGGRVSLLRLASLSIRSPRLVGQMWRLAKQARYAADQLSKALGELLTLTLPWANES